MSDINKSAEHHEEESSPFDMYSGSSRRPDDVYNGRYFPKKARIWPRFAKAVQTELSRKDIQLPLCSVCSELGLCSNLVRLTAGHKSDPQDSRLYCGDCLDQDLRTAMNSQHHTGLTDPSGTRSDCLRILDSVGVGHPFTKAGRRLEGVFADKTLWGGFAKRDYQLREAFKQATIKALKDLKGLKDRSVDGHPEHFGEWSYLVQKHMQSEKLRDEMNWLSWRIRSTNTVFDNEAVKHLSQLAAKQLSPTRFDDHAVHWIDDRIEEYQCPSLRSNSSKYTRIDVSRLGFAASSVQCYLDQCSRAIRKILPFDLNSPTHPELTTDLILSGPERGLRLDWLSHSEPLVTNDHVQRFNKECQDGLTETQKRLCVKLLERTASNLNDQEQ